MDLVAQSETRLTILMIAGAVFAGVGLWLLLRPKPLAGAAKLEFFGLKFEASSAGILVFLIGSAFLAVPLFVAVEDNDVEAARSAPESSATAPTHKVDGHSNVAVVLPAGPETDEQEPNNSLRSSNQLGLDTILTGTAHSNKSDWFVIPVSLRANSRLEFKLRREDGDALYAEIFDARERKIRTFGTGSGISGYYDLPVGENGRFYVRIYSLTQSIYEFSVTELAAD